MVGAEEWEKGPGARRPEGRSCSFHFHNTGRLIMFSAPTAVQAGAQRQAAQGGGGRGGLMYCASQFPKVEIDKIKVTLEAGNLFSVDGQLELAPPQSMAHNVSPHHAAASTTFFYQMCEPLSADKLSRRTLV